MPKSLPRCRACPSIAGEWGVAGGYGERAAARVSRMIFINTQSKGIRLKTTINQESKIMRFRSCRLPDAETLLHEDGGSAGLKYNMPSFQHCRAAIAAACRWCGDADDAPQKGMANAMSPTIRGWAPGSRAGAR